VVHGAIFLRTAQWPLPSRRPCERQTALNTMRKAKSVGLAASEANRP
jgi:hypothetical protein